MKVNLTEIESERDDLKVNLTESEFERDNLKVNLTEIESERDNLKVNLTEIESERDALKVSLTEIETQARDLQALSEELRGEIRNILLSRSWRITEPLRIVSRSGIRIFKIYFNYRKIYPGMSGFKRLLSRSIDAVRKGGLQGLRNHINMHERYRSLDQPLKLDPFILLDDSRNITVKFPMDVAVHIHIYYTDIAFEIRTYLANIPVKFQCYVTTNSQKKKVIIQKIFSKLENIKNLDIYIVENKGRDIAPMILTLGAKLVHHDVVLHIHTKRSPHNLNLRGWRRYLMLHLLGNVQSVNQILHQFHKNKRLGILFPQTYYPVLPFMRIGGNKTHMEDLINRLGYDCSDIEHLDSAYFPSGAMFWFRGKAIEPFMKMQLTLQDFDNESGQCDGTLAHGIERLFPYFAEKNGFSHQPYSFKRFGNSQSGTMPLQLVNDCLSQSVTNNTIIIFDHNLGGGANVYSEQLIQTLVNNETSVLRIYYTDKGWFVQWIEVDDGLIFNTYDIKEMFSTLATVNCKLIVINSLYGLPDIDDAVPRIIFLSKLLKANLDFKIHDFYAVCPSQHLLDFNNKFCGVPANPTHCNACLKKNISAYWASTRPVHIAEWRNTYAKLFDVVNTISFFDPSSVEIIHKAFQIDKSKVKINYHSEATPLAGKLLRLSTDLHVGVLGTLTTVKGACVVNSLATYIQKEELDISVSVIGQTLTPVVPGVKVFGPYEKNMLPDVLSKEGINVVLMASIVPETFSYTISEAMDLGLPIVAFDLGAQGRRVREYKLGEVVPLNSSPELILSMMQSVLKRAIRRRK